MGKTLAAAAAAAAAAIATTAFGQAVPANADSIGVTDPADIGHGVDLRAVHVANGEKRLRIVLSHTNLRRDPRTGAGGAVYVDTDPHDKGPELVFVGGFFEGTDYRLLATEGFAARKWKEPVRGSYRMRLDYAEEQTRIRIGRDVLEDAGDRGQVRVAVKVAGQRTDGSQVVDWLGEPRGLTSWVGRR